MQILFVDLASQYQQIKTDIDRAVQTTIQSCTYVKGPAVVKFEEAFAHTLSVKNVIGTGNGTDSLLAILKVLGIKPLDEVIVPAFTCIATAEAVTMAGAIPVFVDVDPLTYTIDTEKLASAITKATKAVIAVHLYGQAANIRDLISICEHFRLHLIEDCAQAHLTRYEGKYVGQFGIASAFSFYPSKNLGALGDAGAVALNDDDLAIKIRRVCNHGALEKDDNEFEGFNSRMDEIQAAVLSVKLPHLFEWNKQRRQNAATYMQTLSDVGQIVLPHLVDPEQHNFHIFAIRCERRNELKHFLEMSGIKTMIHYPKSLHNSPAYKYLGHRASDFPISNLLEQNILSLPIYPGLTPEQLVFVCEKIKAFYRK
jgi:dTDP-4-amino-4,6-dideoxygalactose transaminase